MAVVAGAVAAVLAAAPASAQQGAGCSWPVKGNSDTVNIAFPDEAARYWLAVFAPAPGTRVKIEGRYSHARYFSFHSYDAAQRPVDSLADFEIDPGAGSQNRFRAPLTSGAGDAYTAYIEPGARPASPAPNTLYTGAGNPLGAVIYRIYTADDPADEKGGVPLPQLTVETADGGQTLVGFQECDPAPLEAGGQVNDTLNATTFPNEVPRPAPFLRSENPPFFDRAGGLGSNAIPPAVQELMGPNEVAFLSNRHVAYLRGVISRQFGDVAVMRAKAPSFPDTRAGADVTMPAQLRYWSICMNEFATQRYVECLADEEAVLDEDGFFTIVMADPEDRPANATRENGINFLPWPGAYYDGFLLYRHMLPAPDFAAAVQRQAPGEPIVDQMGPYGPVARYCAKETIETQGVDACFAG
jgi:hypothetical protein